MANPIKKLKAAYNKACIMCSFFLQNTNKDVNDSVVKLWFQEYFRENDLHEGTWQLHHVGVKTNNNNKVVITIVLGRPGLLIGKGGRNIEKITNNLSRWLEKPVEIKIVEYNALS